MVGHVDLERYLGKWYEVARLPTSFQRDCLESTATYEAMDDGRIRVINACSSKKSPAKTKVARGKAWVVDTETNAKLKVQFFWPFSGDYWILDLGEDYEHAVVGDPSRRYLWVLSRTPSMPASTYDGIVDRMQAAGFDTDALLVVRPIEQR